MKIAKKKLTIIICAALAAVIAATATIIGVVSCGKTKKTSIVIMSEELNGLFNPFYATTGADQDIVGMTQIGMLGTDSNGKPTAGDNKATVVKAFSVNQIKEGETVTNTVYTFVIKNGLKFSDGVPLTMNDIMFNYYEYLDPVYTGSSTLYATKIVGLTEYRTQTKASGGSSDIEGTIAENASSMAKSRLRELYQNVFMEYGKVEGSENSYSMDRNKLVAIVNGEEYVPSNEYKDAVATDAKQAELGDSDAYYREQLIADYDHTLETYMEELELDFKSAKDAFDFDTAPYKDFQQYKDNDIFKFLVYEGKISPVYAKQEGTSRDDLNKIISFDNLEALDRCSNETEAINLIYNDNIKTELHTILMYYGTAATLENEYIGAATDIILHNSMEGDDDSVKNISGIVSLGHTTTTTEVTLDGDYGDGQTYKVAQEHNADGTPKNANEYDVLQITIEGSDPKAIYSFGLTIAPVHYYTADASHPNGRTVDIKNNKFGVEFASSDFQQKVIQSLEHLEVPVGAGAFKATDANDSDNPRGSAFYNSNVVFFKANHNFMFEVKAERIRYQVVTSANAISKLTAGEVDFVTPQFSKDNAKTLEDLTKKGYTTLSAWQLGYGYIGINAGKIEDVNVRRAIMAAMDTEKALEYYETGTCQTINWPMSNRSWAYPTTATGAEVANGKNYLQWTGTEAAKAKIQELCPTAPTEKIIFTIAGSSITEHPTYQVFAQAAEILNGLGWNVEVKADSQALTKLSTGSLQVWAAAWGSTIDPDMYQVYHINSKATSVNAWGYREIKSNQSTYSYEYSIIKNDLSPLIDEARTILDEARRKELYKQAMGYVLDLAVEMPVYQRMNLYAYNSNTITGIKAEVNEYTSPLEEIWNLELK